jgi:rhodanese-related sulfurtransferase
VRKFILAVILFLTACSSDEVTISMGNIDDYLGLDDYQYVDIRELYEIDAQGMISGFEVIPTSEIEKESFDYSVFDENKKILIMCRSGRRAGIIVDELTERGFEAYNVGGIIDYDGENLEFIN